MAKLVFGCRWHHWLRNFSATNSIGTLWSDGLIAWLITGAGAVVLALMLADLSHRMPRIGGPYAYVREAFGDFIGFWIGWGFWISIWSAMAAVAVACVGYVGFFIPALTQNPLLTTLMTLAIIWALTLLNIHSMRASGQFQVVATVLKILPLLFVGLLGFSMGSVSNLPELNPAGGSMLGAIATSVTLVMWAFAGLEGVTVPADDIEDPGETIPRVLVLGTLTVLGIYLLAYTGVILLVPASVLLTSTAPFADATVAVIGSAGLCFCEEASLIARKGIRLIVQSCLSSMFASTLLEQAGHREISAIHHQVK